MREPQPATTLALILMRQRLDASTTLWDGGHRAEGLRLAAEALRDGLATDGSKGDTGADGAEAPSAVAGSDAAKRLLDAPLPQLDGEVTAADVARFRDIVVVGGRIARRRSRITRLAALRRSRPQQVMLAAAAVLLFLPVVWLVFFRTAVRASESWSPAAYADRAFDNNPVTEWLLPDGKAGWVEIQLPLAKTIHRVRILNGYNTGSPVRAAKEATIELFRCDKLVEKKTASFASAGPIAWSSYDVGTVKVDRVRVTILTWHGSGGGLGEVILE